MSVSYLRAAIQYRLDYFTQHCILAVAFFLPLSYQAASGFLVLGTLLWAGRMAVAGRMDLRRTPLDPVIALLVVLAAASILSSPDRWLSFYNYYHLMGRYVVLYYLAVNNLHTAGQLKLLARTVLVSAGLVAAYGFYQYVHGVDISAFEWVDGEQFPELKMRVFSTLQNPNLLAGFLVIVMALAAGLGLNARSFRGRAVCGALVLALGACLVLTYSRGAWLSVLAVIGVYGVLYSRKTFWLLLLIPLAVFAGHDVLMDRLLSILNPTDSSSALRIALWESTVAMIADKPLTGIGWGAYWLVYPQYDFYVLDPRTQIFHAHNMYLHIAAEIGVPGLLAFLALLAGHARLAWKAASADNSWVSGLMLGVLAAFVSIAVSGFTDYIMFNIQLSMLFWLLCAMTVVAGFDASGTKISRN